MKVTYTDAQGAVKTIEPKVGTTVTIDDGLAKLTVNRNADFLTIGSKHGTDTWAPIGASINTVK